MGFPVVQDADTKSGVVASNSTTWALTYPTNIAANDLLLAFVAMDGTGTITWPAGWVAAGIFSASACTIYVAKKKATGSESGNFNITTPSEQGAWRVFRVTGWGQTLGTSFDNASGSGHVAAASASGASLNPNPPSLDPLNWATEDTLWFAVCAVDTSRTFSAFPASYTNTSSDVSGGAGGASLGVARRENAAASEDPGTFTISSSDDWAVYTIGIKPGVFVSGVGGIASSEAWGSPTITTGPVSVSGVGNIASGFAMPAGLTLGSADLGSLADDFSSLGSAWSAGTGWASAGGQLEFSGTTGAYVRSTRYYRFVAQTVFVKLADQPTFGSVHPSNAEFGLYDYASGVTPYRVQWGRDSADELYVHVDVYGIGYDYPSLANFDDYRWIKFVESGGDIFFYRSADGQSWSLLDSSAILGTWGNAVEAYFYAENNYADPGVWALDNLNVTPTPAISGVGGIASAQAFGTPTVTRGAVSVTAVGNIASAETWGTPSLVQEVLVESYGIASAEAWGTPTVTRGPASITGVGAIPSSQAFGTPTVTRGAVSVSGVGGIATQESWPSPSVVQQVLIESYGIATQEAWGTLALVPGPASVAGVGNIASAQAFGTPTVQVAPATISGVGGISSAEAFGVPVVSTGPVSVSGVGGIASQQAFGTPAITTGPVSISGVGGIASAESWPSPAVVPGAVVVSLGGIVSSEAWGTPSVTRGVVGISGVGGVASQEGWGTLAISASGTQITSVGGIASQEVWGVPALTTGVVAVTGVGSIASQETWGIPVVTAGPVSVGLGGITSNEAWGSPVVTMGPVTIGVGDIASDEAWGTPVVGLFGTQDVTGIGGIVSLEAWGILVVMHQVYLDDPRAVLVSSGRSRATLAHDGRNEIKVIHTITTVPDSRTLAEVL